MPRYISTMSGGKASGYVAWWTLQHYPKDDVILFFNDTGWEHPDLFRFLNDMSAFLDHPITHSSDGRDVEGLSYDRGLLPNNRVPFCSVELKGKMMERFSRDGDTILYGIGANEVHRAKRLISLYKTIEIKRKISITLKFPLIEHGIDDIHIAQFYKQNGIKIPELYSLGFKHNNCSGGCVRQSKKQWIHLFRTIPEVFMERERFEREFSEHIGRRSTFMKTMSLEELRVQLEQGLDVSVTEEPDVTDCIGICNTMM